MVDPGVGSGERRERAGRTRSLEILRRHPRLYGLLEESWSSAITAHSPLTAAGAEVEPRPAVSLREHQRYARGERIEDGNAVVHGRRCILNENACQPLLVRVLLRFKPAPLAHHRPAAVRSHDHPGSQRFAAAVALKPNAGSSAGLGTDDSRPVPYFGARLPGRLRRPSLA